MTYIYAIIAIQTLAIIYLIIKVRQPVTIKREKKEKEDILDDLGDMGDILRELQPEIEKGLNLKEDQKKRLTTWVNTVDKVTKSRLLKWILKKVI